MLFEKRHLQGNAVHDAIYTRGTMSCQTFVQQFKYIPQRLGPLQEAVYIHYWCTCACIQYYNWILPCTLHTDIDANMTNMSLLIGNHTDAAACSPRRIWGFCFQYYWNHSPEAISEPMTYIYTYWDYIINYTRKQIYFISTTGQSLYITSPWRYSLLGS